ncbi:MAG TPA: macro domain-containing protein [Nitrospirae bacterium]|nr:O-acetyl-ADP-ribose deacetylase [bacterium BMS3Abin06]HDH12339.1 macro domain-containing protein [Nitrospirota bacterium]HDZ00370.1 macro domain-containing protein [Nitrospirota bacterium]
MHKKKINENRLSVMKGDLTNLDLDAFVFYANDDLKLGSGFGTAIALRGGPSIRKELEGLGPLKVTGAVATSAGNMKSKFIIHANGPKFQEGSTEEKLKNTIINALKCAEEKGVRSIAFPPMGAGFYGVPLDVSARITVQTIAGHLKNGSSIKDVVICALDNREYKPIQAELDKLN